MTKYVEFPLDNGGSILIETSDEPEKVKSGFVRSGVGDTTREWADKANQTFEKSMGTVKTSAEFLVKELAALSPDELEVRFGLKATGEVGGNLAIAKMGGEVNYEVTLKWHKETPKKTETSEESKKEEGRSA